MRASYFYGLLYGSINFRFKPGFLKHTTKTVQPSNGWYNRPDGKFTKDLEQGCSIFFYKKSRLEENFVLFKVK